MIASQIIKHLGINLAKEVKDMYTGKCNTLLADIKEYLYEWRDIP